MSLEDIYKDAEDKQLLNNDFINKFRNIKELKEFESVDDKFNYLFPNLNDPNFNIKISKRKEFYDNKYNGTIENVKIKSDQLCNAEFELSPHQLFVKNFMSFQTPYNSLLLYHGLGSGKTCSAISISEEMRDYLKQVGIKNRIIVVASPNVQDNFKLQLFDETKLKLVNGLWNINSCTGNKFLREINPMNMKGLSRKKVISQINQIISSSYLFLGYTQFGNYIYKTLSVDETLPKEKQKKPPG